MNGGGRAGTDSLTVGECPHARTRRCPTPRPRDPLEPLNRAMYQVNDGLDNLLLKPAASPLSALRSVMVATELKSKANRLNNICICFCAARGPYPVIIAVIRLGCGEVTVTAIGVVLLLVETGLLLRAYTVPTLLDCVGNVTLIRLLLLVIVADKVQLMVIVVGHGEV